MVEKISELVDQFNDGARPLIDFMRKNKNDPFFETEDGMDIKRYTADIAMGATALMLKLIVIRLQDAAMDQEITKD